MKLYYAYYTQDFKNMTFDIFSWFRDDDKHYLDAAVVINFIEMSQRKKKVFLLPWYWQNFSLSTRS